MRQLISQFKKFLSFKSPRQKAPYVIGLIVGGMLIAPVSCRLRQEFSAKAPPEPTSETIDFVFQENPQAPRMLLAKFDSRYCDVSSTGQETWFYQISSLFGVHKVRVNYAFAAAGEAIQTNVDGNAFLVPLEHPVSQSDLRQACTTLRQNNAKEIVVGDPQILTATQEVLQNLAPGCNFAKPTTDGMWECKLKPADPQQTLTQIREVKRDMVMRWSRHPYLLTRRVAMTSSLANALSKENPEQYLNKFCRLLSFSLPEELPLALRTQVWQKSVCKEPVTDRMDIAKVGLADAYAEIKHLKHELESSSRLGTLAVRIPFSESPSKDFWMTLSPLQTDSMDAATAERLQAGSICWHPLYAEHPSFNATAAQLGIVAKEKSSKCQQSAAHVATDDKIPTNYVLSSITSESEFPITNGQAKLLRLPEGQYEYILKEHLEEDPWGENGTPVKVSQGVVDWRSQRPRPVINRWEQQPLVTAPPPENPVIPASLQQKEEE